MSILIKDLKMPEGEEMLCINIYPDGKVCINLDLECKRIATAVHVPPHGNLIDIDALKKSLVDEGETVGIDGFSIDGLSADDICYAIENAHVVIPAEKSEASLCDNCDERNEKGCSWCKRTEKSKE